MKIKLLITVISLIVVFCIAGTAMAMTDQERNILIAQLQAQIAQLYQQIAQIQTQIQSQTQIPTTWCYSFNTNIKYGSRGADITALHNALQDQGFYIAPSELENQYFGDYTTIALNSFQEKYASEVLRPLGLTHGTSFVGTQTRKKLNQLYRCSSGTPQTTTPTCTPLWQCSNWSACVNNNQTKVCTDTNSCGTTTGKPTTTRDCNLLCSADVKQCPDGSYVARIAPNCDFAPCPTTTCIPNWLCSSWTTCTNGQQTKRCYDMNYCGIITNKPATIQSCSSSNTSNNSRSSNTSNNSNTSCIPNWQCTDWSACISTSASRTCTDSNNCGTTTNKPVTTMVCDSYRSCIPNWQCGDWGNCINNIQIRTCPDLNNCPIDVNRPGPVESQYCPNNACQKLSLPMLNLSCIYGLPPYNTGNHIEMEYSLFVSTLNSVGIYGPKRECGCSWYGKTMDTWFKLDCLSTVAGCDFSKVPDEIPRRAFEDYCYNPAEVDPVEWSSRMAKGESYEQAYQSTVENQKYIKMAIEEQRCIREMIDEYYISGGLGSNSWMCPGEKYRNNPNVIWTEWQKRVNGIWVTNFDGNCQ